jgi:hypothetical protein
MEISHEDDDAIHSLVVEGGNRLKLLYLIFVSHRYDARLWPDKRFDDIHDGSKPGNNVRFFNQFPALLRHIAEIARPSANTINHNVMQSPFQGFARH